jgi:hypothetical protein
VILKAEYYLGKVDGLHAGLLGQAGLWLHGGGHCLGLKRNLNIRRITVQFIKEADYNTNLTSSARATAGGVYR